MKLTKISNIRGRIQLVSGLHIGSGNTEMHIGGTDNPVIKNPTNEQPYIPGSSLKGKMRSLLEWHAGLVADTDGKPVGFKVASGLQGEKREAAERILALFGGAPEGDAGEELVVRIGPGLADPPGSAAGGLGGAGPGWHAAQAQQCRPCCSPPGLRAGSPCSICHLRDITHGTGKLR
jgi:hypothetical protein